jgi:hypothetical protein
MSVTRGAVGGAHEGLDGLGSVTQQNFSPSGDYEVAAVNGFAVKRSAEHLQITLFASMDNLNHFRTGEPSVCHKPAPDVADYILET